MIKADGPYCCCMHTCTVCAYVCAFHPDNLHCMFAGHEVNNVLGRNLQFHDACLPAWVKYFEIQRQRNKALGKPWASPNMEVGSPSVRV